MNVIKIFDHLFHRYGPQHWWPLQGGSRAVPSLRRACPDNRSGRGLRGGQYNRLFEICVGAILTQNTAWKNVEKALRCLLEADLMSPRAMLKCPSAKLRKCVRSSGYYKQKTKKLKIFSQWLIDKYRGQLPIFFKQPLEKGRGELLSLWGIGPETADSILLYAGRKPIFVIDAYTKRLCKKHGVEFKSYDEYQRFFTKEIADVSPRRKTRNPTKLYQEYHALIVRWGKEDSR